MEIEYKGGNCIVISSKKNVVVVDPDLSKIGLKPLNLKTGAKILTELSDEPSSKELIVINMPGEYEVGNFSIRGIAARRHIDGSDAGNKAVIYSLATSDVKVGIIGNIAPVLSDEQLEELGILDILILPVGGAGYTLDAHEAVKLVHQIDPKIVIPTHYADKALKYEVAQSDLEEFAKELGVPREKTDKLKLKNAVLPDGTTLYEITRTA